MAVFCRHESSGPVDAPVPYNGSGALHHDVDHAFSGEPLSWAFADRAAFADRIQFFLLLEE